MGTKQKHSLLNIIILSTTTAKKSVDQFCRCDGFNQISLVKCSLRNRMNGMCEEAISHRLIITTFNKSPIHVLNYSRLFFLYHQHFEDFFCKNL